MPSHAIEPVVISTWWFGRPANERAGEILLQGGSALDAAEAGVNMPELDPKVTSVGKGGLPNAAGEVELDAAVYWAPTRGVGAVAGMRGIARAVSVARRVMEATPHCMLAGEAARVFAVGQGFEEEELLTPTARQRWEEWKVRPDLAEKSHDTIGLLARDANGDLCAATSTSGLAWKLPGRVGDSPLVGSGLYADNAVGAAAATGIGEYILRYCASFWIVEALRAGAPPQSACESFIRWMAEDQPAYTEDMVAVIALNREGETGAAATKEGFEYALTRGGETRMHAGPYWPEFRRNNG
ncbi:MAG: N(4)-(beta-N-acetylglucosaminyl)-L-asparaginase [Armatimonadetes bacterium]|nr:N(4)-(beta-N-acetylglucosaminyl)-L-asparaginase [Armatimonadota bacterium]